MKNDICILIVTANKHETDALLNDGDFKYEVQRSVDSNDTTFYNVGKYGFYNVIHFELNTQGSVGADSSQLSIVTAVNAFHPDAVILVGIAFGKEFHDTPYPSQKIGDVLISDKVVDYISGKIKNGDILSDGVIAESGRHLLSTFKFYAKTWIHKINNVAANCEFGMILSGDNVVDDREFKEKLIKRYPRAIGGEMEGRGAYGACRNRNISEWIIVKAICDWADGTKSTDKEYNQITAAESAVSLLNHIFTDSKSLEKIPRLSESSYNDKDSCTKSNNSLNIHDNDTVYVSTINGGNINGGIHFGGKN